MPPLDRTDGPSETAQVVFLRLHKTEGTPSAIVFEFNNRRFLATNRQMNNLVNGRICRFRPLFGNFFEHAYTVITLFGNPKFENRDLIFSTGVYL